jgi:hypothetical protein
MQDEKPELDDLVNIFYSNLEVIVLLEKIEYQFDTIIKNSIDEVMKIYPSETEVAYIANYYSEKALSVLDSCREFISLYDEQEKLSARRVLNLLDTVQVDIVKLNEDSTIKVEGSESLNDDVRTLVLEIALRVIDEDVKEISYNKAVSLNDFIILEAERKKLTDEGLI